MRKTIFPVLIAVSQFVFITAKEPQKTTDEDHNCLLERWSDNDNIKIYNYIGKVRKIPNSILRKYILSYVKPG